MAKYCPNCGKKVNPTDKFCKYCGASLTESVKVPKEELKSEKPSTPVSTPSKPSVAEKVVKIILEIIGLSIGLISIYLVWYTYGCATGRYPNTEDLACQSIYRAFSGGGGSTGGDGGTIAQRYCPSGYCLSNGHCCPSNYRYYCEGKCYASSNEAMSASQGRCTSFKIYC